MINPIARLARIRQIEAPYTFEDLEAIAIILKEDETAILRAKMILAYIAVEHDKIHCNENPPPRAARWLASMWSQSTTHGVNVLARMYKVFSTDDILPNVPLSLYKAVMETNDPRYALRLATDYEFRRQELGEEYAKTDKRGIWSSRDVRNHFDILKGKHLSSTAFRGRDVEVTVWDVPTGAFAAVGLLLSGEKPARASVVVREVLQDDR